MYMCVFRVIYCITPGHTRQDINSSVKSYSFEGRSLIHLMISANTSSPRRCVCKSVGIFMIIESIRVISSLTTPLNGEDRDLLSLSLAQLSPSLGHGYVITSTQISGM